MTSRSGPDLDLLVLSEWITATAEEFRPLSITGVDAGFDADPDGNPIILVTLSLDPPPRDGPWSAPALRKLYDAVDAWARRRGYEYGAHVHLQTAHIAQAG